MSIASAIPELPPSGRVALLGGSFNPPHLAHALVALAVLATEDVEALWVIPCADHPFGKDLAPFAHRLEMCRRAFRHLEGKVAVLDVEGRLPTPSFTVQTLRALHAARPGIAPHLVVGTDILDELDKWREPEALEILCKLVVVPRTGYARRGRLELALPEVSSTEVRRRLRDGLDVDGVLDREVVSYVRTHALYGVGG